MKKNDPSLTADLDALREAWLRREARCVVPPPPSFADIERRAQQIMHARRQERRRRRRQYALAACTLAAIATTSFQLSQWQAPDVALCVSVPGFQQASLMTATQLVAQL